MASGAARTRHSIFGKAVESMDISSLVVTSNQRLTTTPLALSSSYISSTYDQNQDLKAITDKISKALNDFDQMYTDPAEEDTLLDDITDQVDGLEGGMLKSQLKQFINNYKDMSSKMDEVADERDEVLNSLADWFSTTQIDVNSGDDSSSKKSNEMSEALATTKMKFEKLNHLNEEIAVHKTRGRDTAHLKMEKEKLQKQVMAQVKEYKDKTAKDMDFQKKQVNQAWKHAADEIMGLLSKVRNEGDDYRQELIAELEKLTNVVKNMGFENTRLSRELREKKFMERKWCDDNQMLTKENSSLEYKLTRLKKELRATRKKLSRYERVPKSKLVETDEEEEESANKPEEDSPDLPSPEVLNTQLQVTKKTLESTKKSLETLEKEHKELQDKYGRAEKQFGEKDRKIELLEGDKLELLHQMKKINMRPDQRHLSKDNSKPSGTSFGGSVTGISVRSSTTLTTSGGLCENCGSSSAQQKKGSPSMKPKQKTLAAQVATTRASSPQTLAAERRGSVAGSSKPVSSTTTTPTSNLTAQFEHPPQLEKVTSDLKIQLSMAYEENSALKDIIHKLEDRLNRALLELERYRLDPNASVMEITATESPRLLKPTDNDAIQLSYTRFPSTVNVATEEEVTSAIEDVMTSVGTPCPTPVNASGDERVLVSRCIQTDPRCDPIGAWSKGVEKQETWRPPMPPMKWIEYDPSTIPIEEPSSKVNDLEKAMLRGTEPSEVREVAVNAADFVERELDRMVAGILGFMEYLHTLIDREATMMAKANRQLKRVLSKSELLNIEKHLSRPFSSNLRGGTSNLGLTGQEQRTSSRDLRRKSIQLTGNEDESERNAIQQFRDTLLPMEDKVKSTINQVCEEAILMLKKAHELIYNNLQTEHRQYEQIYTTIQDRTNLSFPLSGDSESHHDVRLGLKRSKSQSDITALEGENPLGSMMAAPLFPRRSLSQTAVAENTGHTIKPAVVDFGGKQTPEQQLKDRQKFDVAKATIPKKGLIALTTQPETNKTEMKTFQFSGEMLLPNKGVARAMRKTKPAPLNHQKLMQRQKELMRKTGGNPQIAAREEKRSQKERRFKEPFLESVEDQYTGYTFQDLEAKMDQITGRVKRESLSHTLEHQFDRDTSSLLPMLQRRFDEAKTENAVEPAGDTVPSATTLPPL